MDGVGLFNLARLELLDDELADEIVFGFNATEFDEVFEVVEELPIHLLVFFHRVNNPGSGHIAHLFALAASRAVELPLVRMAFWVVR